MSDPASEDRPSSTVRPALVTLVNDVDELTAELLAGFPSRRDLLRWEQRAVVRTLGEIDPEFWGVLGRQMRTGARADEREGAMLAALLDASARTRPVSEDAAETYRERVVSNILIPAFHGAFRELRKSATEYVGAGQGDVTTHDPTSQRHIAMRPALTEIDEWQEQALGMVLDGFDERASILEWASVLELASHGEAERALASRCYHEQAMARAFTGGEETRVVREVFAARKLIPAFHDGVRTLANRAGEEAQRDDKSGGEDPYA